MSKKRWVAPEIKVVDMDDTLEYIRIDKHDFNRLMKRTEIEDFVFHFCLSFTVTTLVIRLIQSIRKKVA